MLHRVVVSQKDIDEGSRHSARHCPIAVALKRATGKNFAVIGSCAWLGDYYTREFPLPKEVGTFVREFDSGLYVEPFVFEFACEE